MRPLAFMFAGVKLYALGFYHTMEYTSTTPPPELLPYWTVSVTVTHTLNPTLTQTLALDLT